MSKRHTQKTFFTFKTAITRCNVDSSPLQHRSEYLYPPSIILLKLMRQIAKYKMATMVSCSSCFTKAFPPPLLVPILELLFLPKRRCLQGNMFCYEFFSHYRGLFKNNISEIKEGVFKGLSKLTYL